MRWMRLWRRKPDVVDKSLELSIAHCLSVLDLNNEADASFARLLNSFTDPQTDADTFRRLANEHTEAVNKEKAALEKEKQHLLAKIQERNNFRICTSMPEKLDPLKMYGWYSLNHVKYGCGVAVYLTPEGKEVTVTAVYLGGYETRYCYNDKQFVGEVTQYVRGYDSNDWLRKT